MSPPAPSTWGVVGSVSIEPGLQDVYGGCLIDHGSLFAAADTPLGEHPGGGDSGEAFIG
jgi:hypothetical protein